MTDTTGTPTGTAAAPLAAIAAEAHAAFNSGGRHVHSFSARYPAFSLDDAYAVTAQVHELRLAQGYRAVGRKIGFTNRRMWDTYGVRAPNWGYVYDRTLHNIGAPLPLAPYTEPRIEPEIVFGLAAAPSPDMDDAALIGCVAWIAHGFEIVQSIFPGWHFSAADTVAADALHGALLVGPRHAVGAQADEWLRALTRFEIELCCDGKPMEHGHAMNVLDGPLSAVRHLAGLLARDPVNPPLAAGEMVSTGTLTLALPVRAGEVWTTRLTGIALEDLSLRLR